MKRRTVIAHFLLIVCLLYVPVFALVVRTQPAQLYTRLFSQSFEGAAVEYKNTGSFSPEEMDYGQPGILVFGDFVVYADSHIVLSAPAEYFSAGELSRPFEEVFGMIAVYNMYIPQILLPLLSIALLILLVLQLFFCLMSAAFLKTFRLVSKQFQFGENVKIAIMSSSLPALISAAVGFILPAVHIVLFQMATLLVLFSLPKRYDKKERELFSSEENAAPIGVNS
ncbi:MAG: hypothetical protein FWG72_09715 [Oscillospiraceae bacterium]|nr:hypothetical protein [Oscillospiraceae bacterium]